MEKLQQILIHLLEKDTNIFENARFYGPSRVLAGLIYYSITTFGESLDMRRSTRDAKRKTAPRPPCGGRESFFDVCSYAHTTSETAMDEMRRIVA